MPADSTFPPTSTTASVGQTAVLRCRTNVEGNVQWVYFNDSLHPHEQILASDGQVLPKYAGLYELSTSSKYDHMLVVKSSRLVDTGLYGCVEKSGIGNLHTSCLHTTQNCPTIIEKGSNSTQIQPTNDCDNSKYITALVATTVICLLLIAFIFFAYVRIVKKKMNEDAQNDEEATPLVSESLQECKKVKLVSTVVYNADSRDSSSRVFTILHGNLYLVNAEKKKIEVYNIDKNLDCTRLADNDIDTTHAALVKPCCFTVNDDSGWLYLGDRKLHAIFKVRTKEKDIQRWAAIDIGEVQSVSPLKNGLAVLVTEKDIEDKFWRGKLYIYDSNGVLSTKIKVPMPYILPYCVKAVNDDTFAVSYGILGSSGIAIFNERNKLISGITDGKRTCIPGNFWYDSNDKLLIIADAGMKQVLRVKFDKKGQLKVPEILITWSKPGELDFDAEDVRPVRVAYDSESKPKRVFVAMWNGRIDLYTIEN